jgi:CTP-dependent riboflavin kinase
MGEQRDLSGVVRAGRGLAVDRMSDPAVMKKLEALAGFPLVPGTLNVGLAGPVRRGPSWRYLPAAEIATDWEAQTGQAGYFLASVLVAERYLGLAFQAVEPQGRGYPLDQIELFSEARLRLELELEDGDDVQIRLNTD